MRTQGNRLDHSLGAERIAYILALLLAIVFPSSGVASEHDEQLDLRWVLNQHKSGLAGISNAHVKSVWTTEVKGRPASRSEQEIFYARPEKLRIVEQTKKMMVNRHPETGLRHDDAFDGKLTVTQCIKTPETNLQPVDGRLWEDHSALIHAGRFPKELGLKVRRNPIHYGPAVVEAWMSHYVDSQGPNDIAAQQTGDVVVRLLPFEKIEKIRTLVLDPSRQWIVRGWEEMEESTVTRKVALTYQQLSEQWVPVLGTDERFRDGKLETKTTFVVSSASVNDSDFDQSVFQTTLPAGVAVYDTRTHFSFRTSVETPIK